jgi:ankyrin repeat protein
MLKLKFDDPIAVEITGAIRGGDVGTVDRLIAEGSGLATAVIVDQRGVGRSLLHVATDWPGHFPNNAAIVKVLIAHGADVNSSVQGSRHAERPLHWAASCDDVEVIDILLDHGAEIEAAGAVIAGGTALADAVAFAQWKAARRLVERGAQSNLWEAAALGQLDRVKQYFAAGPPPLEEVTKAFWLACHGGQRNTVEYLLERGADMHWVGYDHLTPMGAAKRSGAEELVEWLRQRLD